MEPIFWARVPTLWTTNFQFFFQFYLFLWCMCVCVCPMFDNKTRNNPNKTFYWYKHTIPHILMEFLFSVPMFQMQIYVKCLFTFAFRSLSLSSLLLLLLLFSQCWWWWKEDRRIPGKNIGPKNNKKKPNQTKPNHWSKYNIRRHFTATHTDTENIFDIFREILGRNK